MFKTLTQTNSIFNKKYNIFKSISRYKNKNSTTHKRIKMQDVEKEVTNNEAFGDGGCWCYLQDQSMASSSNSLNKINFLSLSKF